MKKAEIIEYSMLAGMIITILLSGFFTFNENYNEITDNVFRIHILANSDSVADQELKLKVRDAILNSSSDIFNSNMSREETIAAAEKNLPYFTDIAKDTINNNGYNYDVRCEITDMDFDKRYYDSITMPAGNYTALRITIGKAEGHNWWCIMFPPLCLPAVSNVDEVLEKYNGILTEEEIDMLQNPQNYEIKFYCVEMYQRIIEKIKLHNQSDK